MSNLTHPHDRFFKKVFSRPDVAQDFVHHYLPSEIVAQLELPTMQMVKDSFVDQELREHFSDLLYQVNHKGGREAYIYVLFEHKSYPEPLTAFQLLRYLVRIWERSLKQSKTSQLPFIIPLVVYHGSAAWRVDSSFRALFAECPTFAPFIPDFRYRLCDLSGYSDEEIKGKVTLRVALLILKHIFDRELGERLPGILTLLQGLANTRSGLEHLATVLRYVSSAASQVSEKELHKAVEKAFPQTGGALMATIAEQWINQGIKQGMKRGMKQGISQAAREAVLDILQVRFETVPHYIAAAVNQVSDPLLLKRLRKQAVVVASPEELEQVMSVPIGEAGIG